MATPDADGVADNLEKYLISATSALLMEYKSLDDRKSAYVHVRRPSLNETEELVPHLSIG